MTEDERLKRAGHEAERKLYATEGELKYLLARFGDHIAERESYRSTSLRGLDAVRYYLIQKHHWTPATVRSMDAEDLRFAIEDEMAGWTVPADAAP